MTDLRLKEKFSTTYPVIVGKAQASLTSIK